MDKRRFYLFIFIFFSQDPNTVCLAKWVFKILILLLYRMLEKRSLSYIDGPVPVPLDDSFLVENVQRICVCDTDEWVENHDILLFWQVKPSVHVFQNLW
ncbi:pachytene checkpoint protein 2 homolog [Camellia sinensis]|uniref:pachytene checkpoint protein 2 homolog n=1 Tax=Camellia sinensis TaxID=4442 RepID=UPI0010358CC1|nr:pachytene checkpoint protein 2 homolog [Camellia sinensis]